ncbi:hypothetical protein ACC689_07640 [Rhizobium ruizarguesonis]
MVPLTLGLSEFDQPLQPVVFGPTISHWQMVGAGVLVENLEGLSTPDVGAGDADARVVSDLRTLLVVAVQGTSMEGRSTSSYQQLAKSILALITPEQRERFRLG